MSTFGQFLRVTTYGESHCASVGCIVDNFPPGVPISEDILQPQVKHVIMTRLDDTDVLL
jgi:chorismate synthase